MTAVSRMRQGSRMSRSPSLASNVQAAIDKVQIISEVPPDKIGKSGCRILL